MRETALLSGFPCRGDAGRGDVWFALNLWAKRRFGGRQFEMKSCNSLQKSVPNPGLNGGAGEKEAIMDIPRGELERQLAERSRELAKTLGLLKATLESTKDGILALDLSGKVMSFNTKFAALWGFPPEVLARRNHAEMVAYAANQVKDTEKFIARNQAAQSLPELESFDTIELKDGRIFERRVIPQRVNNRCVGVVVNWHEVTQRKRAEQELRDAQALYRSLVDQMPNGVFRKDAQGRFVFVNSAFCRTTEHARRSKFLGGTSLELVMSMQSRQRNRLPGNGATWQSGGVPS